MSQSTSRRIRVHALAAATAVVLSSSLIALPASAAGRIDTSGLASADTHAQFIVKFRDGSSARSSAASLQNALSAAADAARGNRALGLKPLRRMAIGAEVVRSDRALDRVEAETLMRQLAAHPDVESVEVDRMLQALATPNDTRYNEQWHYYETVGGLNLPSAWDHSSGNGVVVAVLDTGITNHTELNANVVAGYDFITNTTTAGDGNGRDSDPSDPGDFYSIYNSSWHGTHVAGTVAAVTNNNAGVAGVAYNARVSPVRVLGRGGGTISDIADAIVWASGGSVSGVPANANPAEVINLSLGGSGSCSSAMQTAINGAVGRGTTVVIAAGNSNANVSGFTPANCNNVIAIASNDRQGNRASYSNYGALIDVTAPGGETATTANGVLSTLNTGTTTPGTQTYAFYQGTSMAAPHVAGVVALMQSVASPAKTPAEIEALLKSTARALPGTCSGGCGAGIVDANAAVLAAAGGGNAAPVANFSVSTSLLVANFTDSSTDSDGSIVSRSWNFGDGGTSTATSPSHTYAAAGTYTVTLTVTDDDGASNTKTASVTVSDSSGPQTYSNTADYAINDNSTVESPIAVSGRSGNAPTNASVSVNIVHTYRGDLVVDLVAPDGSVYNLHNRSGSSADNLIQTYTRDLSTEALNGTWKLRVRDAAFLDTGYINSWSITF